MNIIVNFSGESIAQISDDAFENVISPTDVLIPEDVMPVEKSNVKPAKLKIKKQIPVSTTSFLAFFENLNPEIQGTL